ncbi:MAG: chemotaxis protein CheW [Armatimonadetes bacterium JP3_11]|jgi:purine-binding chemotaxis protein CheW|nr:MAG: chemotaxis protein CheW [Armatimonadetes bacterium CP1_7O]OYT75851.1 MAG: chemotaxis protein CheW [Armatimonadetes bacterium JP3_11]
MTLTKPTIDTQQTTTTDVNAEKYLVFQIGNETYGVPLLQVQEIRTYTPATRVPNAPDYVLGVINLRGNIIAVIDARTRFGLPPLPNEESTVVVVAQVNDKTFGLRLDSVSDVMDIPLEQIQPTPPIASEATQRFLNGVVQVGERVIILLNLREIFDIDALSQMAA